MKTRILPAMCILAATTLAPFSAWAQDTSGEPPSHPGPPEGRPGGGPGAFPAPPQVLDTNQDGSVTLEEYTTAWNKAVGSHFKRLDADGDGVLSREELASAQGPRGGPGSEGGGRGRREFREQDDQGDGQRPPMPPGGRPGGGPGPIPPRPEEFDANQDENVTAEEFTTAWGKAVKAQFKRLDADGDGVLSEEELPKRPGPPPGPPWDTSGAPGFGGHRGADDQHQ